MRDIKPCRICRQQPCVIVKPEDRTCIISCTYCGKITQYKDECTLFDFDEDVVKDRAIELWNSHYGAY